MDQTDSAVSESFSSLWRSASTAVLLSAPNHLLFVMVVVDQKVVHFQTQKFSIPRNCCLQASDGEGVERL